MRTIVNAYEFHESRPLLKGALNALRGENPWGREARLFRELWEITHFAVGLSLLHSQPIKVRLSEEEPADGQLQLGGQLIDVQTTVCNREGRQPDREYRLKKFPLDGERYEVSSEQSTQRIKASIEAKQRKRYARQRPLWLLVFANFQKRGLDIDTLITEVGEANQNIFDAIWLLTAIIHGPNPAFAVAPLFPRESNQFLAYEYDSMSEKRIDTEELSYPFGPMEIEAGKPI